MTGSGRRSSAFAKLNIAEVAPIPMAIEQIATAVNTGSFRRTRYECFKDISMVGSKSNFRSMLAG